MREPSIQRTAALSFAVHLVAFLIVVLVMRQSGRIVMPSPYIVQLVNPGAITGHESPERTESPREKHTAAPPADTPKKNAAEQDAKEKMVRKKMVEDRIATLAAKDAAKKKIAKLEKIVSLRKVLSLKAGGAKNAKTAPQATGQGRGTSLDEYYAKITKEIWQEWVYPDIGRKDIEAVIAVKILKDGTAIVQRVEKSSGNSLFDKSAIKALAKASPLTPPPDEMELGVRFYP